MSSSGNKSFLEKMASLKCWELKDIISLNVLDLERSDVFPSSSHLNYATSFPFMDDAKQHLLGLQMEKVARRN